MAEDRHELLYKFSKVSEYSIDALKQGYAWFSPMDKLNDPFEGQVNLIGMNEVIDESIAIEWFETLEGMKFSREIHEIRVRFLQEKIYDIILDSIKKHRNISYILSLSQCDESFDPIKSRLMWSHYADEMKGFCIEFYPMLFRSISDENESSRIIPVKTDYVIDQKEIDVRNLHPGSETTREIIMEMLKNKHEDWRYENEIRFASQSHGKHFYSHSTIKSIYLGERMIESHKKNIIDIVQNVNPDIQVKSATVGSRYEIVIK